MVITFSLFRALFSSTHEKEDEAFFIHHGLLLVQHLEPFTFYEDFVEKLVDVKLPTVLKVDTSFVAFNSKCSLNNTFPGYCLMLDLVSEHLVKLSDHIDGIVNNTIAHASLIKNIHINPHALKSKIDREETTFGRSCHFGGFHFIHR